MFFIVGDGKVIWSLQKPLQFSIYILHRSELRFVTTRFKKYSTWQLSQNRVSKFSTCFNCNTEYLKADTKSVLHLQKFHSGLQIFCPPSVVYFLGKSAPIVTLCEMCSLHIQKKRERGSSFQMFWPFCISLPVVVLSIGKGGRNVKVDASAIQPVWISFS